MLLLLLLLLLLVLPNKPCLGRSWALLHVTMAYYTRP